MLNSQVFFLLVSLAAILLLGLLVINRDSKSTTNRLFFALMCAISLWSFVNYISFKNANTLLFARLVLSLAIVFATFFFLFVLAYPLNRLKVSKTKLILIGTVSLTVMGLTLSPLVFKSILPASGSQLGKPVVGPAIGAFALTVVFYDFGGLAILTKKTFSTKGKERARRLYLLIGMALMLVTIIALDFVLPSAFSNTTFIPYAPIFILPFVGFTAYAIVRHRLLDIRSAAARGMTYLFSLGSIGLIYGFLIYSLTSVFSSDISQSTLRIFYIIFSLVTALIFTSIKRFFDRVTNKIFFRDSYDSQLFIDRLNTVLVETIDLERLLHKSANLISDTLKTPEVIFILEDDAKSSLRQIGKSNRKIEYKEFERFKHLFNSKNSKVALADDLDDEKFLNLHEYMITNDFGIIAELRTNKKKIGYLITGVKQSGNAYANQDGTIISIVSDELAIAIQNALRYEEIQSFNLTLQAKVDEATHKLRRANDRLRALDETKDDFISMASHQLRTPLTSVKGYISMIIDGDAGKVTDVQKSMLTQAFASSQRMVYLIADMLNVSRLRTGKFLIEPTKVNLADMVEEELGQLTESAQTKSMELIYTKPKNFPDLMLDEVKTRQVIMNFADNALYYTPKGGTITIDLKENGPDIELRVIDNGIGVPKSEQPHLFTKFYRATNARKARPDGTGLGLFMAKKVIVAEGGSLIFDTQEGKGSTFGFSFNKHKLATANSGATPKQSETTHAK
jgi:signal transduction histidine kinase